MRMSNRLLVVAALVAATLSSTGCTSVFPVGTLSWGHGALPMKDGGVRVQAGAGGGAGLALLFSPVVGAGGGAALEYQVNQALLLRVDGGIGAQTPGLSYANASYPYTMLTAGYVGAQLTMSSDRTLAVRVRGGGGVEFSPGEDGASDVSVPYGGAELKFVKSLPLNADLEPWVEAGFGVKVPMLLRSQLDGTRLNSLPAILDVGGAAGVSWHLGELGNVYAGLQAGAVFLGLPTPVASLQAGYTRTF
jgi:hypothetical protein